MIRKTVLAVATFAAIAALIPTEASSGGKGGGGGGGKGGGGKGGGHHGHGHHGHWGHGGYGFGGIVVTGDSCWRWNPRLQRRVYVCY